MVLNKFIYVLVFCCLSLLGVSQATTIVFFKDKGEVTYSGSELFTLESHARKSRFNVPVDSIDYPVYQPYLDSIKQLGITVISSSKWLNASLVEGADASIDEANELGFVKKVVDYEMADRQRRGQPESNERIAETAEVGEPSHQLDMIGLDYLHEQGFNGEGIRIAVIDGGFRGYNTNEGLKNVQEDELVIDTYDFPDQEINVSDDHEHGLYVMSIISAESEDFKGAATDASLLLYRSENTNIEYPVEEFFFTQAAERADSIGVDIINMSIGYSYFDSEFSAFDYTSADLDGETGMIAKAAQIASNKNILVVASAGNEGNSSEGTLLKPADVADVLTVGAVDAYEDLASFSSIGPTADGRIKPEVLALGQYPFGINTAGTVYNSLNGTSFSAPLISGLAACLWQAFPNKTSSQIKQAIVSSADRFNNSDNKYGYGIPDGRTALELINGINEDYQDNQPSGILLTGYIKLENLPVEIFDINGKKVLALKDEELNTDLLSSGLYFLRDKTGTVVRGYRPF